MITIQYTDDNTVFLMISPLLHTLFEQMLPEEEFILTNCYVARTSISLYSFLVNPFACTHNEHLFPVVIVPFSLKDI